VHRELVVRQGKKTARGSEAVTAFVLEWAAGGTSGARLKLALCGFTLTFQAKPVNDTNFRLRRSI